MGALQALGSVPRVLILSDALNHASLIDGCRLSRAEVIVYRHGDAEHVESLLKEHRARFAAVMVVTESLFSMDGDLAPVRALRTICDRYDAALFVDEAHALGALGPRGRGLCAALGVQPDVLTAMFGKAFGASGAFVAASDAVVRLIENRARCYVFSTAPSPTLPAAALAAMDLVADADDRRARLAAHAQQLRNGLGKLGFRVPAGHGHVIPVLLGAPERAAEFSAALLERGVFVHGIRPPTVPHGTSRLRVAPIATHDARHIDLALEAFGELVGR
jgi:7-keto-8-aminopelargonate synthetase-like enzyme